MKSAKYKSNTEACLEIMKPIKNMTKLHDHNSNTTSKQYPALMHVEEQRASTAFLLEPSTTSSPLSRSGGST